MKKNSLKIKTKTDSCNIAVITETPWPQPVLLIDIVRSGMITDIWLAGLPEGTGVRVSVPTRQRSDQSRQVKVRVRVRVRTGAGAEVQV